ncbi:hypothetical protein ACJBU6_01240 [Exserohilum turcicum]
MNLLTHALNLLISAILLASVLASLNPSSPALKLNLSPRDMLCEICIERYDFCVENGHTKGQAGCKETCAEHVCHVQRRRGVEVRCSKVSYSTFYYVFPC